MSKSTVLKFFSGLAFVISACFSIINLWGTAFNLLSKILSALMGVTMEYGKVTSIYKAFSDKKLPATIRGALVAIYAVLLTASIFFSMSFISNEENQNKNYDAKHSKMAYIQSEKIKTDNSTINSLQSQIDTIKKEYTDIISQKTSYINGLPKDYITVKQNSLKEIERLKAEMTAKINNVSDKILQTADSKKATLDKPIIIDEESTTGFTSLLSTIVNWHNADERGKENPWTLPQVQFIFYLILSITFELLASLLWYLAEHESRDKIQAKIPMRVEPNLELFGHKKYDNSHNDDGAKSNDLGPKIIELYKQEMIKSACQRGDKLISRSPLVIAKVINDNAGAEIISNEQARKIRGKLEEDGHIVTIGTQTVINQKYGGC